MYTSKWTGEVNTFLLTGYNEFYQDAFFEKDVKRRALTIDIISDHLPKSAWLPPSGRRRSLGG
jgi:hypothetical protein